MAVFVLYMDKEFGWDDSRKASLYGLFLGMVYFIPVLGGWIGDRVLGRRVTILAGAACMAVGYVWTRPFIRRPAYRSSLPACCLVAFGTGILKVNMSVLLGNLYKPRGSAEGCRVQHLLHGRESGRRDCTSGRHGHQHLLWLVSHFVCRCCSRHVVFHDDFCSGPTNHRACGCPSHARRHDRTLTHPEGRPRERIVNGSPRWSSSSPSSSSSGSPFTRTGLP